MPIPRHPKRRGEWVELKFMAAATAHDIQCSKPWGDSCPYDNLTDYRAIFNRIQIKSSSYRSMGKSGKFYGYPCNVRPPSAAQQAKKSRKKTGKPTGKKTGKPGCPTLVRVPRRGMRTGWESRAAKINSYAGKIDFFAFYLVPEDLWYIIPASALRPNRSRCAIHLNPYNPRSYYSQFLEAWHLLKRKRSAVTKVCNSS